MFTCKQTPTEQYVQGEFETNDLRFRNEELVVGDER